MNSGAVVQLILTAILSIINLKPYLLKVQSDGYGFISIFAKNKAVFKQIRHFLYISALYFVLTHSLLKFKNNVYFSTMITVTFFVLEGVALSFMKSGSLKKPFVATPRAIRLYSASAILAVSTETTLASRLINVAGEGSALYVVTTAPLFVPLIVFFANLLMLPFEKLNNLRYERKAQKRLAAYPALIKIGVTGSFGKTSVKNALAHMLESRYRVLATEGNFNTPLGIAKTVNRLDEYVDVFIAEMGARKIGDISRLMKLVSPQIGVLTGVTNQHLETFKSLENVYAEKEKVITLLSTDGYGVVNASSLDITKLSALRADFVGVDGTSVYAEDVDVGSNGVTFKLVLDNKKYVCHTKLLGVHNMQNLITAASVALYLKIPPEEIVRAIGTMPQIPHRLQLIKNGGVTIIDDTYNGNPVGAAEAINALRRFSGRKIAVTPGLVELGADEDAENERLGERLAEVFDKVVLIGKSRAAKIKTGLIRGDFSESDIAEYPSLQRAEAAFPTLFKQGDTVLFLNDLPDVYNE